MAFSLGKIGAIVNPITSITSGISKVGDIKNLFGGGGSSVPTFNPSPYITQLQQSQQRQQDIINGLSPSLGAVGSQFTTAQNNNKAAYGVSATQAAQDYQKGLSSLDSTDKTARDLAIANETARQARAIPEQQQAIRESLAATGGLRTGGAGSILAQPQIQMSQNIAELAGKLELQGLDKASARREAGLTTLYNTEQGVALTNLGIDQDTARTLLQNGRADILSRANALLGIDQDTTNSIIGLETTGQLSDIAASQAAADRRAALISAIGGTGGAVIGGLVGGLPGATAGLNIGKSVGTLVGNS